MKPVRKLLLISLALAPMARAGVSGPIVCNPGVFTKAERARHIELISLLKNEVAEVRELPDGYAFRYGPGLVRSLADWTALETRCCPFIDFQIELEPQPGGAAWLRLRGEGEVQEFIRTEFEPLIHLARGKAP